MARMKSELDDLVLKLRQQQTELCLVIKEAEAKIGQYTKTIADGRAWLAKIETLLEALRGDGQK